MIRVSERPGFMSSIAERVLEGMNYIAVYRTRLPCDALHMHLECEWDLRELAFFLTVLFFRYDKDFRLEMLL